MVDTNKKLPEHGWDTEEIVPKYGTTYGKQDILGNHSYYYANPSDAENYSYQKYDVTGSYETLQKDGDKNEIRTSLKTGEIRGYNAGGVSTQTDGHNDVNIESTSRRTVKGDDASSAKRSFKMYQTGQIESVGGYSEKFTVGKKNSPLATTKNFVGTDGDEVHEHAGNRHEAFEKDYVQAVSGNKLTMVENGDYGIHVQTGNYDTHIAEKGRIYTENDLLIESGTKIVLKVGNSTIEILPSKVTIISDRIDLNP